MDRDLDSVRKADKEKEVEYRQLRQALDRALPPGWTVLIATVGVREAIVRDRWKSALAKVGLPTT